MRNAGSWGWGVLFWTVFSFTACGRPGDPLTRRGLAEGESTAPWVEWRDSDLLTVTRERGPLVASAGVRFRELERKPWSGWWLPANSSYLFGGTPEKPAPLQKYDAYTDKKKESRRAAAFERDRLYDPNAIAWEGSCDAWAMASLLEPEPREPVTREGIVFSVGDQKALLIKSYELAEGKLFFGQAFRGTREGVYDDLYPDQLQRFVETELLEGGRPFILDKDPGIAVWNTPIWRAEIQLEDDPSDPRILHGRLALWGADPWVRSMDEVGTRSVVLEYTYDLYGDRRGSGELEVRFGLWTRVPGGPDSVELHPDFVASVPEKATSRGSRNRELDVVRINEILNGS
jgi:hypothetical protein